ncbi:MAG: aminotransferase class V-fold PLP-dependent enzyme [Armatimonadetes bacterium]|nr:aminotransferase class V-fold PLP-dependent enzyme [Armatimonadota bacterium]MDE2208044.1 aminotransferase class V-fold PLP-dependent enzyme [Armatimonadota bacterium]
MRFSTRAIHVGQEPDSVTGGLATPIHVTSTYALAEPGVTRGGFSYSRIGNPTRSALETCLASLEGAPANCPALSFSTGMAATDCALRLLQPGDRLLLPNNVYGGTWSLADKLLRPAGIRVASADFTDLDAVAGALKEPTSIVWSESPSNPLMMITDLEAVAHLAHDAGALLITDSTFATPALQNPLQFGCDVVMHSTTKYIGGHSDLLGGALIAADPSLRERLNTIQCATGATASPWDCWLTLRGVRTLALRMAAHEAGARRVAAFLESHPRVSHVWYPGSSGEAQRQLYARQMRGFGGMVAFEVAGDAEAARRVMRSVHLFALAASLGGVESIMSYPAQMSHADIPAEIRRRHGVSDQLIRLSVGLEDPEDLVDDLSSALDAV